MMINPVFLRNRISSKTIFNSTSNFRDFQIGSNYIDTIDAKPPNIVVHSLSSFSNLQKIIHSIESCLVPNCYTVYPLSTKEFLNDPWIENARVLILLNPTSNSNISLDYQTIVILKKFLVYGKILSFTHMFTNHVETQLCKKYLNYTGNLDISYPKHKINEKNNLLSVNVWNGLVLDCVCMENKLICIKNDYSSCVACYSDKSKNCIASTLPLLEVDVAPNISQQQQEILSYLLYCLDIKTTWDCQADDCSLFDKVINNAYFFSTDIAVQTDFLQTVFNDGPFKVPGLEFVPEFGKIDPESDSATFQLNVKYVDNISAYSHFSCSFDWKTYQSNLFSKKFGKLVLYADVLPTTMTVFDSISSKFPYHSAPVAIARQQTKGQGRGGNKWLSPIGCAMFTLVVHIPTHSHLGSALPLLQHLTTVAVVHAIRTLPGLQNLDLRVKWPNDIYYGSTTKVGGVLVKSTIIRDYCIASIGCGVNIANAMPTVGINHIIKEWYGLSRDLSCEEVIARTISYLEQFVNDFENDKSDLFLELYYKYWLHRNVEVTIVIDSNHVQCTIVGIDNFGFLRARRHDDGEVLNLHPDGNSFDIMKNLIVAKKT